MVFPISDDNSDRRTQPIVNYVIIALNVLVFAVFQRFGENEAFTYKFSAVPAAIVGGEIPPDQAPGPLPGRGEIQAAHRDQSPIFAYFTLLTSMFMHANILHLLGNMWFLFIFGDNVEDDAGHLIYAAFYLFAGVMASLCHVLMNMSGPDSLVPSLGASGAISGVMGAYLVLNPTRPVKVAIWRVIVIVPGYVAVGLWFLFQLVSGLGLLGGDEPGARVAYAAHIGGFLTGVVLSLLFAGLPRRREPAR